MLSRMKRSASSVQRSAALDRWCTHVNVKKYLNANSYDHQKSTIEAPSEWKWYVCGMKLSHFGLLRLQTLEYDIALYWPTMCRPTYKITILLTKLKQYHTIFTLLIGPISKRYITLSIGFNVEITLQNRDKRSASGGFAPRPPPGALPLDPAGELPSQVPRPQAPGALLRSSKLVGRWGLSLTNG